MLARLSSVGAAAIAALLLATPDIASAQSAPSTGLGRAIVVFGQGGGFSPITDINEAGTAKGKTGWTVGGGVGVQINRFVVVRGTFDYAQSEIEGIGAGSLAGEKLNHFFYGGDVQLRYPTRSGFAPYLLLGAGAVTLDPSDRTRLESVTKFAGKGGLGFEYVLPSNGLGFFAQATSYLYEPDKLGFDKTQADIVYTAGLSYRFGF
ncbi:MAG: outer membrane beta-barrel protein [Gemmatimonadota bacterium]